MNFLVTVDGETRYKGSSVVHSMVEHMHCVRESRVDGQEVILLRDGKVHKEFIRGRKTVPKKVVEEVNLGRD